eukprot:1992172-Amphidinium_carterae.1
MHVAEILTHALSHQAAAGQLNVLRQCACVCVRVCVLEDDIATVLHGDEMLAEGTGPDLEAFANKLKQKFEFSVKAELGPEDTDVKQCVILNRVLSWTEAETGTLHVKELRTPSVTSDGHSRGVVSRAAAARAMDSQDRSDIAYSAKEICRGVFSPNTARAHATAEYGKVSLGRHRPCQLCNASIRRRSTSGCVVAHGNSVIHHYSATHATVSLSSGESEYGGLAKAAAAASAGLQGLSSGHFRSKFGFGFNKQ